MSKRKCHPLKITTGAHRNASFHTPTLPKSIDRLECDICRSSKNISLNALLNLERNCTSADVSSNLPPIICFSLLAFKLAENSKLSPLKMVFTLKMKFRSYQIRSSKNFGFRSSIIQHRFPGPCESWCGPLGPAGAP